MPHTDVLRLPPSGTEAHRLEIELTKTWAKAFARDQRMRDLQNRTQKIELLPETNDLLVEPVEYHTGRSGALLDHAQSFVTSLPSLTITPLEQTTEERRETEQTERAFKALFHKQLVANGFWSKTGRSMLLTGRAVLICLPLPSVWTTQEGFPVRAKGQRAQSYIDAINKWKNETGEEPIILQSIPSDRILLKLDSNDKPLAALEVKQVNAGLVAEALGSAEVQELLDQHSLQWYDQLEVLQYIDDIYVCYYLISTRPIRPETPRDINLSRPYDRLKVWKHGLGKMPVVFVPGVTTDEQEYEFRFKPFLADAEESLRMYDFVMSRLATMVTAFYFPSFEWKVDRPASEFQGEDLPDEHVNIGGTTVTYRNEELRPIALPSNLPDASLLQ
ncbi:hypothetical protein LCGC14_2404240, partial [marine sediment metagenome]